MTNKDYIQIAWDYAQDIVSGAIPACQLTRQACQRFINELESTDFGYQFNAERASRACAFMGNLKHVKGKWAGKKLKLEPWQVFIVANLFGWETKDGIRRFRRAFVFLPRKSGKSLLAAGIALLMLTAEAEPGSEVYVGATSEDQANEVFRPACAIADSLPDLKEAFGLTVYKTAISNESGMGFLKRIIGKPGDGQSPMCAIHDEYHEHQTSRQVDAMYTGMGARQQPLQLIITTAGYNVSGPCKEFDDYTRSVVSGSIQDDQLFAIHYTCDPGDDWKDFNVWIKANPNYGVSVTKTFLKEVHKEALNRVSVQNDRLTKHLNLWVNAGTAWMNIAKWDSQGKTGLKIEDFTGHNCFVGVDLASKIDMTAVIVLFKLSDGRYTCFMRAYLPEDTVDLPENQHYRNWASEGWLTVTEGARTNFGKVEDDLKDLDAICPIKELTFDPREASYLTQSIEQWASFPCIEIPQGPAHMSEPMKELEAIIYDGKIEHDTNPILSWMMGNVQQKETKTGPVKYYYPTRGNTKSKIDGVVALIMALSRAMVYSDPDSYLDKFGGIYVL